jgi:hypothetical protein
MQIKINGKVIDNQKVIVERTVYVEREKEIPDYVAWMIIALGILAIKGWLSLW